MPESVKIAYIVLAHNAPDHLARLVKRLQHPDDVFFIHIDVKSDEEQFKNALGDLSAIHFVKKRENGRWGGIELVNASLNAMKEVSNHKMKFDHVVLLSGADYPIKSTSTIRAFYAENKQFSFISFEPFPVSRLNFEGMDRINYYTYNFLGKRETFIPFRYTSHLSLKGKVFNLLLGLKTLSKPKRTFPFGWTPYYGSQWWSLSMDACVHVLQQIEEKKEYLDYHFYTQIPDEVFFQSLLLNSYPKIDWIINDNKRWIEFEEHSSHPKIITESDIDKMIQSDKLFARKFEEKSLVLNLIDEKICE